VGIKSITLKNFQSHEHTTIDFDDGVNAIIGLSDSGKTAILRALRWVMTNKPSGEEFRSYWGGDTSVTLELDNGIKVTRGRTNSDNFYVLHTPGVRSDRHQEFRAFGQDVPEEIKKVLNISEINMAAQMDAPFLLSSNPGERAQMLNRIVNLDVIDKAISNVRKEKMEADRMVRQCEDTHADLTVQLEGFNYIPSMEGDVVALEVMVHAKDQKVTTCTSVKQLVAQIKSLKDESCRFKKLLTADEKVMALCQQLETVERKKEDLQTLRNIIQTIKEHRKTVANLNQYKKAEKTVTKLIEAVEDAKRMCDKVDELNNIIWDLKQAIKKRDDLAAELKRDEAEFNKLFPETCPLCGQEVRR